MFQVLNLCTLILEIVLIIFHCVKWFLIISYILFFIGFFFVGVCHGDDISFYFKSTFTGSPSQNSDEWKTIDRMCSCFTAFAKTGDPNNDVIAPVQWEPVTLKKHDKGTSTYKCLNMAKEITFIDSPELDRMQYWDNIYKKLNQNIIQ